MLFSNFEKSWTESMIYFFKIWQIKDDDRSEGFKIYTFEINVSDYCFCASSDKRASRIFIFLEYLCISFVAVVSSEEMSNKLMRKSLSIIWKKTENVCFSASCLSSLEYWRNMVTKLSRKKTVSCSYLTVDFICPGDYFPSLCKSFSSAS